MLPSSNPDAAERFQWYYDRAIRDFKEGGSEAVFKARLYGIGYRGARLEDEVRYQKCLVESVKVERPQGFVSGLAARSW